MAVDIPRHDFPQPADSAAGLTTVSGRTQESIERLELGKRDFDSVLHAAMLEAKVRCLMDPQGRAPETRSAFVTATQISSALFASAMAEGGTVRECIGGVEREIPDSDAVLFADASVWATAFWLAVICRDRERLRRLCEVPDSLLREDAPELDEFNYAWVDALRTYWLEQPGLGEKLVSAVEGCNPETVRFAEADATLMLFYPPMHLFHRLVTDDPRKFNEALADALEWHKEFWTEDADRARNAQGLVAIEVLGVACLAFDAGFPIEVRSDYLPEDLLKRRWQGPVPA